MGCVISNLLKGTKVKNLLRKIVVTAAAIAFLIPATAQADTLEVDESVVDCTSGMFAVGGYPKPEIVPEGYLPIETPGGIFSSQNGGFNKGQEIGAANLVAAVDAYAAQCPDSAIFIRGHSYGAAIVHTALETIDKRDYAPRVIVELTGNPRNPGGIEDTFSGSASLGIEFRGEGITPENVLDFVSKCNERDGICNLPSLSSDSSGFSSGVLGYFTGAHRYGWIPETGIINPAE